MHLAFSSCATAPAAREDAVGGQHGGHGKQVGHAAKASRRQRSRTQRRVQRQARHAPPRRRDAAVLRGGCVRGISRSWCARSPTAFASVGLISQSPDNDRFVGHSEKFEKPVITSSRAPITYSCRSASSRASVCREVGEARYGCFCGLWCPPSQLQARRHDIADGKALTAMLTPSPIHILKCAVKSHPRVQL